MSVTEWTIGISSVLVMCAAVLIYILARRADRAGRQPNTTKREMRLPVSGIPADGIGVGDAVKRVTDAFRIKPCNGCEKRRNFLNRWVIKGKAQTPDPTRASR